MADQTLFGIRLGAGTRTEDRATVAFHVCLGNRGVVAARAGGADGREHQGGVCRRYRHAGIGIEAEGGAVVRAGNNVGRDHRARAGHGFQTCDDREAGRADGAAGSCRHQQTRNHARDRGATNVGCGAEVIHAGNVAAFAVLQEAGITDFPILGTSCSFPAELVHALAAGVKS